MSQHTAYLEVTKKVTIQEAIEKGFNLRRVLLHEMIQDDEDDSERIEDLYYDVPEEQQNLLDRFCHALCGRELCDVLDEGDEVVAEFQLALYDQIEKGGDDPLTLIKDADEDAIAIIDEFVVDLCGWTLNSLIRNLQY